MDTTDESCRPVIVANGDYPVRSTEEVLHPFFTDESLQAAMDPQHPPASSSITPALAELRLVLLGRKGAGKSAAGNTILGGVGGVFESGRPTEECVKRRAEVAGRKVTVVDTPGWEWYYPLNSTPNWVRRETLRSVSLCPPGPHAVLLVVRACASVTEGYIGEMEEHLEPLGRDVWDHTMLLFTRGDELGLASMEQRILTSGAGLQRLLQKCGNRYHVVDNRSRGDGAQVRELIRKLEEMVAAKRDGRSSHLEMDHSVLLGLEADGKRRARERRKKQRQMEEQMQRGTIKAALMSDGLQGSELDAHQSFSKAPRRLPEVRLVLLGERETGKSSAGNTILGGPGFFRAGEVTEECVRQQAEVSMRLVTVVDAPGWEEGVAGATPERVKREVVNSVALCPPGPHAVLLTLRVDTLVRAGHVREHLELLGDGVWRHTILLFTHGDQLRAGVDIEQHIQGGGRDLQGLLDRCRGRYHVISSVDGAGRGNESSCKVTELLQKVEKMSAMNRCEAFSSLVHEVRDLSRQRNEKFGQRLKDMGDKMLRQEAELKNMREREMKSIRWIFDRKKKVKSPGKADIQREEEEEEDRRTGERRNDIGELEERMQWLTQDKEREIQDLNIEKERIRVALNQIRGERDEATLNLELKEREMEELKERIDEQQLKLLDLERANVENEHKRKQREEAIKVRAHEWKSEVKKLEETIELQRREKAEWMEKVDSLRAEIDETKRHYDSVLERKAQEKNREMAETVEKLKAEMEIKLLEKDKEQEELRERASEEKQITLDNLKQMERKVEEMVSKHEKETERKTLEIKNIERQHQEAMSRKMSEIEKMKAQHQKEMDQKLKESADDKEKVRRQHDGEMRDVKREKQREIDELKEQFAKERRELKQANDRQIAELEQRFLVQMEGKMLENKEEREKILLNLSKDMAEKMREKEKEVEVLKTQQREEIERKIQEFERAMEARRDEHREEIERKVKEKEEDVEKVQQEYSNKIKDIKRERQSERSQFEKQLQDGRNEMRDLEQKHEAQIKEKMQENEKEKQLMSENHKKETERLIEELKQKHRSEIEAKTQESANEKDKMVANLKEKDREMEEVKASVREMKEKLRQKDEKESENMKDKEEMERRLGEREKEIEGMKLNVREVKETLQQKEEKERQDLIYRKDLEQRLKERERETKAMKERLNELQQQLHHAEEKDKESSNTKKLMERKLEENERLIEKLSRHIEDIDEILQRKDDERGEIILNQKREAERRLREREEEMEEMKRRLLDDVERKLSEKQSEVESLKRRFESEETGWREEQRKRDERGESEMNRLSGVISEKTKEIEEARRLLAERDGEIEEARKTSADNLKEIETLKTSVEDMQRHHTELERRKDAEAAGKLQEKDEELDRLRRRDGENEKELIHLRLTIEQTRTELKQLAGRMEKETTSMIQEYEKEIARRDEGIEAVAKERDRLREESRKNISDVTEKYEESRRRVEELQEQNEKMRKEADNLKIKCEEMRKVREEEVGEHLKRFDLQVKKTEAEIQSIEALKEANEELKVEMERMKEREGEAERRMNDMRERFQTQLEEKQSELRIEGEKTREEILKREEEVGEREREARRNEAGLSKRGHELDLKEGELSEKEAKLESKEQELGEREAGLEKQEKELEEERDRLERDVRTRAKNMARKEKELESLLQVLEGKQQELNCHGQDLQKKVRGLKDQGKELKDKEFHLRNEEQEMLSWMSKLQLQNEHVHSTTQELDEMGRDLALLRDELRRKEENMKAAFRKLSTWERDLKEREAALLRGGSERREDGERVSSDPTAESAGEESGLMHREVNGRRGEARGREADKGERDGEDQRAKTAMSAKQSNNCLLETMTEEEEGETRRKKDPERSEVSRGLQFLSARRSNGSSNNKNPPGSDLKVVVLGESWSTRSPATGLGFLCGEASESDGSTFRRWRGQVSGRRLAVVEPLGLRWRDGPDPDDAAQQRSIRDGASWCRPGPDAVLLLVPAFLACTPKYRRAAERHAGLLGEDVWRRALVLFTWGETLGESAEQHILRNGELTELVERCGGRFHVVTSRRNNSAIEGLLEKMEDMLDVNSV